MDVNPLATEHAHGRFFDLAVQWILPDFAALVANDVLGLSKVFVVKSAGDVTVYDPDMVYEIQLFEG